MFKISLSENKKNPHIFYYKQDKYNLLFEMFLSEIQKMFK